MFTFILPIYLPPPPPDYYTLDESIYEMAEKKVLLTHKRMCYYNSESEQDQA